MAKTSYGTTINNSKSDNTITIILQNCSNTIFNICNQSTMTSSLRKCVFFTLGCLKFTVFTQMQDDPNLQRPPKNKMSILLII